MSDHGSSIPTATSIHNPEPEPPMALNDKEIAKNNAPVPPESTLPADSVYSWLVVLGSFFNLMLSVGATTTYGVYLQEYMQVEFPNVSSSYLSWIGTLQFALMCFFGIGVGVLCERIDTRILSGFGALITGLSLIIASFCNSPWKLLITQGILFGFGGSFLFITGLTLPPQWFVKYRALGTGVAIAGSGIGGLWLSFATRAITENISRRWALRITGLIIIGVCGCSSLLMRMRFRPVKRDRIFDMSVLRDKRFVLLFFGGMFGIGGYYIPFYFMPSYSNAVLGKPESWGTNIAAIMNAASIAGRIVVGIMADYVGPLNTLLVSTLLSCLSILVLWLPFKDFGTFIAAGVVFGFCSGAIVSLIPVVTAGIFGIKRLPSIMGFLMIGYTAGALISAPPAGHMLDVYGHGTGYSSLIIYDGVFLAVSTASELALRAIISRKLWKKA
ncbi:hypothetical protein IW150_001188 [Coemansia sp. RSA 2607]|nr:hypothetical protein IW150_001188 [Coemansia sp. RSA 2607]KAJ2388351.1 hypothetical protein GGI05_003812 [Coemansia sp. RSA 2603]